MISKCMRVKRQCVISRLAVGGKLLKGDEQKKKRRKTGYSSCYFVLIFYNFTPKHLKHSNGK